MLKESYASQKDGMFSPSKGRRLLTFFALVMLDLQQHIIAQLQKLRELEDRFDKMSSDFHSKVENAYLRLSDELTEWQDSLSTKKTKFEKEKELMRGKFVWKASRT